MLLQDVNIIGEEGLKDIFIVDQKIARVSSGQRRNDQGGRPSKPHLSLEGALAFPGLINSHDHLDFNLFPLMGHGIYNNYTEWGWDIHKRNAGIIDKTLQIPKTLRTKWGIYKNLLNGFTTVVNHGERVQISESPIMVFQDCECLHSPGFEKNWRWKLNRRSEQKQPFVFHVGEGTDSAARLEIDRLIRWNLFNKTLIGVHGVAMNEKQAASFRALVWCPASNYFLLDKTAPIDRLKEKVSILFGTDSTLTAGWNSWDQIRMARKENMTTDIELFDMLTKTPAAIWALKDRGEIEAGRVADLVIARSKQGLSGMDGFYALNPGDILLVICEGQIKLFDPSLLKILTDNGVDTGNFRQTGPESKYTEGDLPGLMKAIRHYYPAATFPAMPD